MNREGDPPVPPEPTSSSQKVKRQQVLAACQNCRHQKIKCDGQPVCRECRQRNIRCVYVTRPHESHGQAAKRRAAELFQANHILEQIFRALAGEDEDQAVAIFRSIRAGQQPVSILDGILQNRVQQNSNYESQLREAFIIALAQSTARLDDIVDIAASIVAPLAQISLPHFASYRLLRDRIVTLDSLRNLLATANSEQISIQGSVGHETSELHQVSNTTHSGPTFSVPASPWTSLTADDDAVSHLVTIFLTYINPYWRCVEEDLFLEGMRQPTEDSAYCTSLLVHAILACASLYSEIDEAFAAPGNLLTRGDHFHNEAVRLWELEQGRRSLANMQALLILAVGSLPRGKCQLGWSFVKTAAAQNKSLLDQNPKLAVGADSPAAKYVRARACAANSIVFANVAYAIRLLANTQELELDIKDASDLEILLPDVQVWWNGYPLKQQPVPFRSNLLIQYRWQLTCFGWEFLHILFSTQQRTLDQLWTAAMEFSERLAHWRGVLPTELHYTNTMPPALYEFHGHCLCVFMNLYRQTYAALSASEDTSQIEDTTSEGSLAAMKNELRSKMLEYAIKAAELSRDFGSEYGWKIAPPYIPQQATSSIFIFLQEMRENATHAEQGSSPTTDVETAFEECFRCLLGCGVHQMLSRGIARMIYHTVTKLELKLPSLVERIIQIVAETAWRPSDLNYLDSIFPNPIVASDPNATEQERQMGTLLKEWEEGSD